MNRIKEFQQEVNAISRQIIRAKMPEPKKMDVDIIWEPENIISKVDSHKWASVQIEQFIKDNNFVKCKKKEATLLIIAGEKSECGCFIIGKYKNIWLKAN
jgi:hypothetical protein